VRNPTLHKNSREFCVRIKIIMMPTSQMNGHVLSFIKKVKNTPPRAMDPSEVYWNSKTQLIA
jgi:hypothetical protein